MVMIIPQNMKSNLFVAVLHFSVTGVDLYSTISVFLGSVITSVFGVVLIYCVR